jgi:hypothetical protein
MRPTIAICHGMTARLACRRSRRAAARENVRGMMNGIGYGFCAVIGVAM